MIHFLGGPTNHPNIYVHMKMQYFRCGSAEIALEYMNNALKLEQVSLKHFDNKLDSFFKKFAHIG